MYTYIGAMKMVCLNPLRNNPLVEGVNTEAASEWYITDNRQTNTYTQDNYSNPRKCGPRSSVAVERNTHSKILCNVLSLTLYNHRGLVSIVMMNKYQDSWKSVKGLVEKSSQ